MLRTEERRKWENLIEEAAAVAASEAAAVEAAAVAVLEAAAVAAALETAALEKCLMLHAQNADNSVKFLLNQEKTGLFIAEIATQKERSFKLLS